MENTVYMEYFEGREGDRGGRNYTHIGWNIHPLLWSGYKVYGVRICG